jgi:biotin carboxylase
LQYPLILKPCRGWGSSGVYRADNTLEFAEAAEAIAKHYVLANIHFNHLIY